MKYPIEKYKIIVHQHPVYHTTEVIACSTYAGKVVKGKAICHVDDVYNEEQGKRLAVARCANKIAMKRKARSAKLLAKANTQLALAQQYVDNMTKYHTDACVEVAETEGDIKEILAKM